MGSLLGIFVSLITVLAVSITVAWVVLWCASLVHSGAVIVVGLAALGYLTLTAAQTLWGCAAEPVFVPPIDGSDGEGSMIYACDGPGGMLSYYYALLVVPVADLTIALMMWRLWRKRVQNV